MLIISHFGTYTGACSSCLNAFIIYLCYVDTGKFFLSGAGTTLYFSTMDSEHYSSAQWTASRCFATLPVLCVFDQFSPSAGLFHGLLTT